MTYQVQIIRDNTTQLKNNMYGHHIGYDLTEEEFKYLIEQAAKAVKYEAALYEIKEKPHKEDEVYAIAYVALNDDFE